MPFKILPLCAFILFLTVPSAYAKKLSYKGAISRIINGFYKDEKVKGAHYEILMALSAQINRPIQIETVPVPRQATMFMEKKVDLIVTTENDFMGKLQARKIPIYEIPFYIFSLSSKPILTLENAKGRIGRVRGGCTPDVMANKNFVIEELKTYQLGIAMLEKGRLDGVCGSAILYKATRDLKWPKEKTHILPVATKPLLLLVQSHLPEDDFKLLQSGIQKISKNGTIEKIFRAYQDIHDK